MNTKTIVAGLGATAVVAVAAANYSATLEAPLMEEADYKFMNFVSQNGRSYATKAEFQFRSQIFKQTLAEIEAINASPEHGHVAEVNFLADMTPAERKRLNSYKGEKKFDNIVYHDETNLQASVDWRSKGAVTPVKNQGQCGSCWAFSTTGAVEGAMFVKTGKLVSLSEQQLVDCAGGKYGNMGCNGGLMDSAFNYIKDNGLELESAYGYTAKQGTCQASSGTAVADVISYTDVAPKNKTQFMAALNNGPVSVAIEADQSAF